MSTRKRPFGSFVRFTTDRRRAPRRTATRLPLTFTSADVTAESRGTRRRMLNRRRLTQAFVPREDREARE